MNQGNEADNLNADSYEKPKLPQGLNILTILTFIACGFWGLVTLCMPLLYDFLLKLMNDQLGPGKDLTAKKIAEIEKGKASIELMQQNAIPLLAIGMIGLILCFIGALWMRKLKKDGFWLYVAGQLVPIIGGVVILGTDQYQSVGSLLGLLIPIVFIVLYAFQRKYLVK